MSASLNWEKKEGVLYFQGTLDRETLLPVWQKRKTLLADINIIDISALGHIDSTGLALFVHLKAEMEEQNRQFIIQGVSERFQTLITLYDLDEIMNIA
ncbi:lipid asymmetry maintenance protein MlaB [Proteus sp. GOKU]|uniref:lipid asymmetry maintenance protein MlaB n=1 Tax=Proteus TaxID=583 RepID=UPI000B4E75F2|nr:MULTISPECIES: lipid asymmetry maintenance protein MlaB [Proteus]MDY3695354.1 lipid asymmetry maintenance protein MlaB [Proteus mirabilis]PNL48513.1 STAS domain-containing protein [Proteus mirabilis]QPB78373.1 lipid asymmetry maintenance protein MlaB [Proteus sp. GOKU]QQP24380.1 lipid asymmetry maintenance protein MlaB [Proteus vulgaris]WPC99600.1 lipid asymmetry maintenance protein MlaB [Proteus terrae]